MTAQPIRIGAPLSVSRVRCASCRMTEAVAISPVYAEIWAERQRQNALYGHDHDDSHEPNTWVAYITRYLGEATHAFLWKSPGEFLTADFRTAMIKVAALAVAAVESLDRRG